MLRSSWCQGLSLMCLILEKLHWSRRFGIRTYRSSCSFAELRRQSFHYKNKFLWIFFFIPDFKKSNQYCKPCCTLKKVHRPIKIADNFIRMAEIGPDSVFKGSPTVSPTKLFRLCRLQENLALYISLPVPSSPINCNSQAL